MKSEQLDKLINQFIAAVKLYYDNQDSFECRLVDLKKNSSYHWHLDFVVPEGYRRFYTSRGRVDGYYGRFPGYKVTVQVSIFNKRLTIRAMKAICYNSKGEFQIFPNTWKSNAICQPLVFNAFSPGETLAGILDSVDAIWKTGFNGELRYGLDYSLAVWLENTLKLPHTPKSRGTTLMRKIAEKSHEIDWEQAPVTVECKIPTPLTKKQALDKI